MLVLFLASENTAQDKDAVPRVIIVAIVLGSILFVIIKLMIITCCIKQRKENRRREEKKLGKTFSITISHFLYPLSKMVRNFRTFLWFSFKRDLTTVIAKILLTIIHFSSFTSWLLF